MSMMTATNKLSMRKLQRKTKETKKTKVMLEPQVLAGSRRAPVVMFLLMAPGSH